MSKEAQAASSSGTIGFETIFTRDFIERSLPKGGKRILEIGCGTGELAGSLSQNGFNVVAIDSDPEAAAATRARDVDARVVVWPNFSDGLFDAVVFMRSLHHIRPLNQAVAHAAECLVVNGRLIVEDFAPESVDEMALRWLARCLDDLERRQLVTGENEFLNALRLGRDVLAVWRNHHEKHDVSPAAELFEEISGVFGEVKPERAPYYFRYLANALRPTSGRNEIVRKLAEQEAALICSGEIFPLGRRFVATKRRVEE